MEYIIFSKKTNFTSICENLQFFFISLVNTYYSCQFLIKKRPNVQVFPCFSYKKLSLKSIFNFFVEIH